MKNRTRVILVLLLLFFIFLSGQALGQDEQATWESKFHEAIQNWIGELSAKEVKFAEWASATYKIETLGPNSKQWLVSILKDGERIGYLVIGISSDEELHLLEYGIGEISLFEPRLLSVYHPELITQANHIKLNYYGFQSIFHVIGVDGEWWIDGKTGELLPDEFKLVDEIYSYGNQVQVTDLIPTVYELYQSFLEPLSKWDEDFPVAAILNETKAIETIDQLTSEESFLSLQLWNGKSKLLLPVRGVQTWDTDKVYVAVEQEGYRFIPVNLQNKTDGELVPSVTLNDFIVVDNLD